MVALFIFPIALMLLVGVFFAIPVALHFFEAGWDSSYRGELILRWLVGTGVIAAWLFISCLLIPVALAFNSLGLMWVFDVLNY